MPPISPRRVECTSPTNALLVVSYTPFTLSPLSPLALASYYMATSARGKRLNPTRPNSTLAIHHSPPPDSVPPLLLYLSGPGSAPKLSSQTHSIERGGGSQLTAEAKPRSSYSRRTRQQPTPRESFVSILAFPRSILEKACTIPSPLQSHIQSHIQSSPPDSTTHVPFSSLHSPPPLTNSLFPPPPRSRLVSSRPQALPFYTTRHLSPPRGVVFGGGGWGGGGGAPKRKWYVHQRGP